MKTALPDRIENLEEAKAFLKALWDNGEAYHPEDNALEIVTDNAGTRLFTDIEAAQLNQLHDQIYALDDFDPCEYLLELDGHEYEEDAD